jgi:hypothetical protein
MKKVVNMLFQHSFEMKNTTMLFLFLAIIIAQSDSQQMNTLLLTEMNDVRYECTEPGCSSSMISSASSLRTCQRTCLMNPNCRTITFDQSRNQCEIFADISSQYGSLMTQIGVVTCTAVDDRRLSARK